MAIYQVGNSLFHAGIYAAAQRTPGVVVLHDYTLHHFVASITAGRDDFPGYLREMTLELGTKGADLAWAIRRGAPTPLYKVPMTYSLLSKNVGTLVHSEFARTLVQRRHPRTRVATIGQPVPLPPLREKAELRRELGLPTDAFVITTCGADTPEKHLGLVSEAIETLQNNYPRALWLDPGIPRRRARAAILGPVLAHRSGIRAHADKAERVPYGHRRVHQPETSDCRRDLS